MAGKLIIENRTKLSMEEALVYVKAVVKDGYVSGNGDQYCYASIWPDGIVVSSFKNKKSDRLVLAYNSRADKGKEILK